MRFQAEGLVVANGAYDFNDGKSIAYVDFAPSDGTGVVRGLLAEGANPPEVMKPGVAVLDLRPKDKGGFRLGFESFSSGGKAA